MRTHFNLLLNAAFLKSSFREDTALTAEHIASFLDHSGSYIFSLVYMSLLLLFFSRSVTRDLLFSLGQTNTRHVFPFTG